MPKPITVAKYLDPKKTPLGTIRAYSSAFGTHWGLLVELSFAGVARGGSYVPHELASW